MRVADTRFLVGDDDVAHQRNRRAETGGGAVQAAHDRFLQFEQRVDDVFGVPADGPEISRIGNLGFEPVEVAAGAEGAADRGQDDDVAAAVALQFGEHAREFVVHRLVDAIHRMVGGNLRLQHASAALEGETLPGTGGDVMAATHLAASSSGFSYCCSFPAGYAGRA